MLGAYWYRIRRTALHHKLMMILILVGIIGAFVSFSSVSNVLVAGRDNVLIQGIASIIVVICIDYAFAVGFRSGVLGLSLSDVVFHLAGPFTPRFNLGISFTYGASSALFFLWVILVNSPFLRLLVGFTRTELLVIMGCAFICMVIMFLVTSYLSAAFPTSIKARVIPVALLIGGQTLAVILILVNMIREEGSWAAVKELGIMPVLSRIGNTMWFNVFSISCWKYMLMVDVVLILSIIVLYKKTNFDFYETAMNNAQKIADVVEASKAGVEAINTGISRAAKVGNEKFKHGWGASAFLHMHLFQNRRESKLFFVNKLSIIYRIFALIILLVANNVIEENLILAIMGITTMMVLNAIVYGGGKTVFEFNRPYFFIVPEKINAKFAACMLADVPEMLFDSLVCAVIIKLTVGSDFGVLAFISLVIMMVLFDLLSQTVGLICVRLFRSLGKSLLMPIRYILEIVLIFVGMTIAAVVTEPLGTIVSTADGILAIMIGSMALSFAIMWMISLPLATRIITKGDVS